MLEMCVEHTIRLCPLDYKKALETDVVPTAKRAPKRTKPEAADEAANSTKYNLTFRKEKVPIFT